MSVLIAAVSLFSILAGFDLPIFKESIADRIDQVDVCSGSSCHERVAK